MKASVFTSLLLLAPAFGQSPDTGSAADGMSVAPALPEGALDQVSRMLLFDEPGDGLLWASGSNWKASFGEGEFHFVPFLGSDAPQNYPVEFALESVTVAGEALPLADSPRASREDRTITMDHVGVREVYHAHEESIEQTFVFDALPGSGDVVVRVSVDSDLEVRRSGPGFTFTNALGGLHYGGATAIAADGDRLALDQTFVDGGIEIRVPASFVATAEFPLVIDPILSTMSVVTNGRDQVDVDIAYDGTTGVYMIVYSEANSVVDHDIRSVFYNTNVDLLLNEATIDITTDKWAEPSVAASHADTQFLCVATRGASIGLRDVWGRTREANTGTRGAPFVITSLPGDNACPDVGGFGDTTATNYQYFVVWQNYLPVPDDYDIWGQAVTPESTLIGAIRGISTSTMTDDKNPSISKSSGRPEMSSLDQQYMVAWEREESPTNRDLWGRITYYTGSTTGHDEFLCYSLGDARNVDVSAQTRMVQGAMLDPTYVMVFERLQSGIFELYAVAAREGNPDNARSISDMQDIAISDHHADPKIASDGTDDFFVVYKSEAPGGWDAHVTTINIVRDSGELRTGVSERRASFDHPTGGAGALAIASTYDGGLAAVDSKAMVLWTDVSGADGDVGAAMIEETLPTVDGSQYCRAEDNASGRSAWIRASGSLNDPNADVVIRVSDLPMNAFGYVIASVDTGFTTNPGGSAGNLCLSGAIGRFNHQVIDSGAAGTAYVVLDMQNVPQPTGTISAMSGDRWKFQYWTRDVQGGMATSNFSNGVVIDYL